MKTEYGSYTQIIHDLRAKIRDKSALSSLDELEGLLNDLDKRSQAERRIVQDEIVILRELTGTSDSSVKLRFASQEKQLSFLKQELEDALHKLTMEEERISELVKENESLLSKSESTKIEAMKAKSGWAEDVESLEKEKKILSGELSRMEATAEDLKNKIEELSLTLRRNFEDEKRRLSEEYHKQIDHLLSQKQWSSLSEERTLLQGLYTYIQNHMGGISGSSGMILDRMSSMQPPDSGISAPAWKRLLSWPLRAARALKTMASLSEELKLILDTLNQNSENLKKLQKGMTDFSSFTKVNDPVREKAWLAEIAEDALNSIEIPFKERRISVKRNWNEVPPVAVDKTMIKSALKELFENAMDAQPQGGSIEVSLLQEPKSSSVSIAVEDSGPGVPAHLSEKIFQPFFTTKPNHSGLGLTRTFRWVSLNGGTIELTSGTNKGLFVIKFPVFKESAPSDA